MARARQLTKRQVLKYGAATGAALLAGCGGQGESPEKTEPADTTTTVPPTTTPTETPTQTPTETTEPPEIEPVVREFLSTLGAGDYEAAADLLSPAGESQIEDYPRPLLGVPFSDPVPALQRTWLGLTAQHRGFQEIRSLSADADTGAVIGTIACGEADQRVRVTVSDEETIRRLEFLSEYSSPGYGPSDGYEEQSVMFESDDQTFEGTLTTPVNTEAAPCIVLVQGAGIYDRDSTAGPNKIFADIARGLANRGVATYRYDRRRPGDVSGEFTPENFIVDDAVAAVKRVARSGGVKSDALFVGGHSQGGRFTPQIAEQYGSLAGMLIFDTLGFGYLETQLVSTEVVLSLDFTTEQERKRARELRERVKEIQKNGLPGTDRVLGSSRSWVKANLEYDRIGTADRVDVPTFVIHGGRLGGVDKRTSLERWESGVDNPGSQFTFYKTLNHYLQPVDPPSVGTDFQLFHDNVSEDVIGDVADWVKSQ